MIAADFATSIYNGRILRVCVCVCCVRAVALVNLVTISNALCRFKCGDLIALLMPAIAARYESKINLATQNLIKTNELKFQILISIFRAAAATAAATDQLQFQFQYGIVNILPSALIEMPLIDIYKSGLQM